MTILRNLSIHSKVKLLMSITFCHSGFKSLQILSKPSKIIRICLKFQQEGKNSPYRVTLILGRLTYFYKKRMQDNNVFKMCLFIYYPFNAELTYSSRILSVNFCFFWIAVLILVIINQRITLSQSYYQVLDILFLSCVQIPAPYTGCTLHFPH